MSSVRQSSFQRAISFTLRWEGGYVNDPADPGGETNFGISKRSYPDLDIASLTEEQAREIYRRDYWDKVCGSDLPALTAIVVFDWAVHSGPALASRALQRSVGANPDGVIGPRTLESVYRRVGGSPFADSDLAAALVMKRGETIARLVSRRPTHLRFMAGWMKRMLSLMREVRF